MSHIVQHCTLHVHDLQLKVYYGLLPYPRLFSRYKSCQRTKCWWWTSVPCRVVGTWLQSRVTWQRSLLTVLCARRSARKSHWVDAWISTGGESCPHRCSSLAFLPVDWLSPSESVNVTNLYYFQFVFGNYLLLGDHSSAKLSSSNCPLTWALCLFLDWSDGERFYVEKVWQCRREDGSMNNNIPSFSCRWHNQPPRPLLWTFLSYLSLYSIVVWSS